MGKKLQQSIGAHQMAENEAEEPGFPLDPVELQREIAETKRKAAEVERGVERTEESIRRGARRTNHRFRL
jgi:hypothetical protein